MATDFKVYQADIEIRLIDLASDKLYDLEEVVKSTIKAIEPRISTLADTINSVSRAFDKLESSIDVYKELDKL
ncbi:MAG: hypothetical protein LC127_03530 [Chitinophagales bacterium]|nr:hypothetical protein [Chitinophagales bacterium]